MRVERKGLIRVREFIRVNIHTFFIISLLASCDSTISVNSLSDEKLKLNPSSNNSTDSTSENSDTKNEIEILSSSVTNISATSFDINLSYEGDDDNDAVARFYYCNQTDSPGCDPVEGSHIVLSRVGDSEFSGSIDDLGSPYDFLDTVNYSIVVTDQSGVVNTPPQAQLTLIEHRNIYRSVGPSNTSALASGGTNDLTISNSTANFSVALGDNIGVGDALQFDSNGDGMIDQIAFIHERIDAQNFKIHSANGSAVDDLSSADNDWSLFRAYTSLADAENGDENTAIDDNVENFDTWSGGHDLVSNNFSWHIALYKDATDNGDVTIGGWVTGESNKLNVYTPTLPSQVGTSQRHLGKLNSSGYTLSAGNLRVTNGFIVIDGLKVIDYVGSNWGALTIDTTEGAAEIILKNNIVYRADSNSNGSAMLVYAHGGADQKYLLANNVAIYNTEGSCRAALVTWQAISSDASSPEIYIYNNTLVAKRCRGFLKNDGNLYLKNNLAYSRDSAGFANWGGTGSIQIAEKNLTNSWHNIGAGDNYTNIDIHFNAPEVHDYRLGGGTYSAIGTGLDLSSDPDYPITEDISGNSRDRWDIGASSAQATAIFRSIGPGNTASLQNGAGIDLSISLNTDGHTQASFSSAVSNNVGLGDVIQYDADASGGVDTLAFISEVIDDQNFIVKDNLGQNATITSSPSQSWDIFRAYNNMSAAEDGSNENVGIDPTLVNFDNFSGGKDIVSANEQWNFIGYADAKDTVAVDVDGWVTSNINHMKFLSGSPHKGIWSDDAYTISINSGSNGAFSILEHNIVVDGIQFELQTGTTATGVVGMAPGTGDEPYHVFRNNIIRKAVNTNGIHGFYMDWRSSGAFVYNNIIYGFNNTNDTGFIIENHGSNNNPRPIITNNTITKNNVGIYIGDYNTYSATTLRNNLVIGNTQDINSALHPTTVGRCSHNATGDSSAQTFCDPSDDNTVFFTGVTPDSFIDFFKQDFRIYETSTPEGVAMNFSEQRNFHFDYDASGRIRRSWDVGALSSVNGADNDTLISNLSITNVTTTGFDIRVRKRGDNNANGSVSLYYCNKTDDPTCDPIDGTSALMSCAGGYCDVSISSLSSPNDPNDLIELVVMASDSDGVAGYEQKGKLTLSFLAGIDERVGLIAYWDFDDTSGDLTDFSGNNKHATAFDTPSYSSAGIIGSSISFDSGSDRFEVAESESPDLFDFSMRDEITYMGWIYPTELSGNNVILIKGLVDTHYFQTTNSRLEFGYETADDTWESIRTTGDVLSLNTWHHIAVTYTYGNGASAKIYVNGVEVTTSWIGGADGNKVPRLTDDNFIIGYNSGEEFRGRIDEFSIWSRALTGTEIQSIFLTQASM